MTQASLRGFLLGTGILLTACGGGGGGGGSTALSYSGETSQADITLANGEDVGASAFENGASGDAVAGVFASLTTPNGEELHGPHTKTIADLLRQDITEFTAASANSTPGLAKATQSVSGSSNGECGGTASYSISVNDVNNQFSGSISYVGFCDDNTTINGSLSFSGSYANDEFGSMTLSLNNLTVVAGAESLTVDGTIAVSTTGVTTTVVSNILLGNNAGDVFKTEDLTITSVAFSGYEEVSYSGRFYHPDYGYVTLSTPTGQAFHMTSGDDYPSSGQLVATGANGGTVTLTATSNLTYQLDVFDGTTTSTTTGTWDSL